MKDLKKVVNDIVESKSTLNEFYGIKPARPVPGAPAVAKNLAVLEDYICSQDLRLPPSYRAFLTAYDGIKNFDTFLDLLSAKEVSRPADRSLVSDFPNLSKVVIALGNTPAFISFDSDTANKAGEMETVWVAEDGAQDRYADFDSLLRTYRDILQEHVKREQADRKGLPN